MQSFKHLTTNFESIPKDFNKLLQDFAKPHLESFNFMLEHGLSLAVQSIPPMEFATPNGSQVKLYFENAFIGVPSRVAAVHAVDSRILPSECRLKGTTYSAKLNIHLMWSVDDEEPESIERPIGDIPLMVKSSACFLSQMTPEQLIHAHEDPNEFGGYFIVNGVEKLIRMLIVSRRNYPIVLKRPSWRQRGQLFSEIGVSILCVAKDESACNMVLHYLTNGMAKLMISCRKELYFIPVILILKALCDYSDYEIYSELIKGREDSSNYKGCIAAMLRQVQDENLYNRREVLAYIGNQFRSALQLPEWYSAQQVAECLLHHSVCIHLESNKDKFNLIVFMIQKLYAAVSGQCALETHDNPMNQEVLLGGHVYLRQLKEKLMAWLLSLKMHILRKVKTNKEQKLTIAQMHHCLSKVNDLTRPMEFFLATGNFQAQSTLGLLQNTGLSIVADRLNFMRFVSHFRSVHRGSFFAGMQSTAARKLYPEAWGFICPVHTPDGAPCGLLNHLAAACEVVTSRTEDSSISSTLCSLGMSPYGCPPPVPFKDCYSVILNGRMLGYIPKDQASHLVSRIRHLKATSTSQIPRFTEICMVPSTEHKSQYPGLFLFTTPARMMRPVRNLSSNTVEYIGTFEQVYLNISVTPKEIYPKITTHLELNVNSMLSFLANLIPLPDFNQSPRNMYQCQMNKQTMGTPTISLRYRSDNKLYRLLMPQSPLFRTLAHDEYQVDNYPFGTNAVVAVISYTGYDMEDAMIINKSSFERGFAHACLYKHISIDATDKNTDPMAFFGCNLSNTSSSGLKLQSDGMPSIGSLLKEGDPFYSYVDIATNEVKVKNFLSAEESYVEDVIIQGSDKDTSDLHRITFRLRVPRNPIIGDKFASRHGQKGICSQMYPQENMPFTESGITPDIIFNPHGFPSRMTIGMMIECMAGKSAALHGLVHDASPFKFSENDSAIDYFGKFLEAAGYNYYGTEKMYSGVDGRELNADIFFGVVYYQRLRHMVADKFQVRSTGPVDMLTRQPIKGRKRGGGIRFGEMERDSLIAHGASFLLHDRLFNCSDRSLEHVCTKCGGLLSPIFSLPKNAFARDCNRTWTCSVCDTDKHVELLALPFVFRYLAAELASINVKVVLSVKNNE